MSELPEEYVNTTNDPITERVRALGEILLGMYDRAPTTVAQNKIIEQVAELSKATIDTLKPQTKATLSTVTYLGKAVER